MTDNAQVSAMQLMRAQVAAEFELTFRSHVYDLVNVLSGIASCATQCPCCQSHNESALEALERFAAGTGVTREEAWRARRPTSPPATSADLPARGSA